MPTKKAASAEGRKPKKKTARKTARKKAAQPTLLDSAMRGSVTPFGA